MDPGGPGDRVTVFVVYNHPLITPLGLAEYVRMEARRSGVNESFRASRALNAVQGSPPGANQQASPTPRPPTETPLATDTWTPTPTLTHTPTATHTPTQGPFTCDNLAVTDLSFDRERVYFHVYNDNVQTTQLDRVRLSWQPSSVYSGMFLSAMAVNSSILWRGEQVTPRLIDTGSFVGTDRERFDNADRNIPGNRAMSRFEAVFLNAGNNLGSHLTVQDFAGSVFEFYDTTNNQRCVIEVDIEDDQTDPDDPDNPTNPNNTPTPTFTPDCASESMRVRVDRFDTFGVVVLRVESFRHQPSPMYGFLVDWTPAKTLRPWLTLDRITVGGSSANDTQFGVEVWRGNSTGPTTTPNDPSTTYWRGAGGGEYPTVYTFPPFSTTFVYLDFGGTSTDLATHGIGAWMFNNTRFDILCVDPGSDGSGSGSPDSGSIYTDDIPSPTPIITNTPVPTPIPGNLVIDKVINWDGNTPTSPAPEFWICVRRSGVYDQCHRVTASNSQIQLPDLPPGTYTISEYPGDRWRVSINGQIRNFLDVQVTSSNTTTVNVNNRYIPPPPTNTPEPPGNLTITKSVNWNGHPPLSPAPTFQICVQRSGYATDCRTFSNGTARPGADRGGAAAWRGGATMVDDVVGAVRPTVMALLPVIEMQQLSAMRAFLTEKIRDVTLEAGNRINSQLGLVVIGAQTPFDAVKSVSTILNEQTRRRATTIVHTELGRAFSTANQIRMEQAAEQVPGLKKRWISSGKLNPRAEHLVIDGQEQPVDQPFVLEGGAVKMMYPHDPAAPARHTINCGCVSVPVVPGFKRTVKPRNADELDRGRAALKAAAAKD